MLDVVIMTVVHAVPQNHATFRLDIDNMTVVHSVPQNHATFQLDIDNTGHTVRIVLNLFKIKIRSNAQM